MVNPRTDELLKDGSAYTYKTMPNGEERRRIHFSDGPTASITTQINWVPDGEPLPWQAAHYHMGLFETYLLVSGWVYVVWIDQNVKTSCLKEPGQTLTFKPAIQHLVLPGPKSVILTSTYGDLVPNPDRGNNDWWPAEEDFSVRAVGERTIVESIVRTMV